MENDKQAIVKRIDELDALIDGVYNMVKKQKENKDNSNYYYKLIKPLCAARDDAISDMVQELAQLKVQLAILEVQEKHNK